MLIVHPSMSWKFMPFNIVWFSSPTSPLVWLKLRGVYSPPSVFLISEINTHSLWARTSGSFVNSISGRHFVSAMSLCSTSHWLNKRKAQAVAFSDWLLSLLYSPLIYSNDSPSRFQRETRALFLFINSWFGARDFGSLCHQWT